MFYIHRFQLLLYILLTMYEVHLYAKLLVQMLSHMLGGIDRTMLTTCAAKANRKIGKTSLYVTLHAGIYQGIDMIQESEYLAIFFEELDDWFVESDKRFVAIILAGIVDSAAVEHEAATITCGIIGDAFLIGKAHHPHLEVLLRLRELFELREFREYLAEVRIFAERLLEQLAEIIYGKRHALNEVWLLLEVAAETIGTQHLQRAEKHEVAQLGIEIALIYGLILAEPIKILT